MTATDTIIPAFIVIALTVLIGLTKYPSIHAALDRHFENIDLTITRMITAAIPTPKGVKTVIYMVVFILALACFFFSMRIGYIGHL